MVNAGLHVQLADCYTVTPDWFKRDSWQHFSIPQPPLAVSAGALDSFLSNSFHIKKQEANRCLLAVLLITHYMPLIVLFFLFVCFSHIGFKMFFLCVCYTSCIFLYFWVYMFNRVLIFLKSSSSAKHLSWSNSTSKCYISFPVIS